MLAYVTGCRLSRAERRRKIERGDVVPLKAHMVAIGAIGDIIADEDCESLFARVVRRCVIILSPNNSQLFPFNCFRGGLVIPGLQRYK